MKPQQKVLSAALDSIVAEGVAGVTLRDVADRAGVSLGSVSYYFGDKEGLLYAAFAHFTREATEAFEGHYGDVDTLSSAREATVSMFLDAASDRRGLTVGTELYAIALRRPRYRLLLTQWVHDCQGVLARYFDKETTLILDAVYQGLLLHTSMHLDDSTRSMIHTTVLRLTPPESYLGPGSPGYGDARP